MIHLANGLRSRRQCKPRTRHVDPSGLSSSLTKKSCSLRTPALNPLPSSGRQTAHIVSGATTWLFKSRELHTPPFQFQLLWWDLEDVSLVDFCLSWLLGENGTRACGGSQAFYSFWSSGPPCYGGSCHLEGCIGGIIVPRIYAEKAWRAKPCYRLLFIKSLWNCLRMSWLICQQFQLTWNWTRSVFYS